jgi:hypothetical protein
MDLTWFTWLYRILDSICSDTREDRRDTVNPVNIKYKNRATAPEKVWISLPLPDP